MRRGIGRIDVESFFFGGCVVIIFSSLSANEFWCQMWYFSQLIVILF